MDSIAKMKRDWEVTYSWNSVLWRHVWHRNHGSQVPVQCSQDQSETHGLVSREAGIADHARQ